jgi:excisionase family DNA binding protein
MSRRESFGWIPVRSAASLLGVSPQRVYQLIAAGRLMATRVDSTWLVRAESVGVRMQEQLLRMRSRRDRRGSERR